MKISFLLSIVALAVAVVADPAAVIEADELHVAPAAMIGNKIVPQSKRSAAEVVEEQIAAAALVFNTVQPLEYNESGEDAVAYAADNEATGLEARDLEKRGVCKKGYGLCSGQNKCCPIGGRCCTRGCCKKGYQCWISARGQKGCCPVGKRCA